MPQSCSPTYGWYNSDQWSQPVTDNPLLESYDSQDSAVVARQIEWGKRAGLTAFSVSWHGEGSATDVQLKRYLAPQLQTQEGRQPGLQLMVLFETPDMLGVPHGSLINFHEQFSPGVTRGDKFVQEMGYLADTYFGSTAYHRIDRQPAVFVYLMRDVINHQSYFDTMRSNVTAKGFDLYLIGDVIHWQNPVDGVTVPGEAGRRTGTSTETTSGPSADTTCTTPPGIRQMGWRRSSCRTWRLIGQTGQPKSTPTD